MVRRLLPFLAILAVIAIAAVATMGGGQDDEEPGCAKAKALRAATLAATLEPRYRRVPIDRRTLDDVVKPLASDLPDDVAYEAQLLVRKNKPAAYVLVLNSSLSPLPADEVYDGFAGPEGGVVGDVEIAGRTGRMRSVVGGHASVLALGGCSAVSVGSESQGVVEDVSRRLELP
jgi:hypothetical protein